MTKERGDGNSGIPKGTPRGITIFDKIQARHRTPDRLRGRFTRLVPIERHLGVNMDLERQRMLAVDAERQEDFESVMERAAKPLL